MRTDDDAWGVDSSVGVTAVGVAAARAAESARPDALITDPFAARFVQVATDQAGTSAEVVDGFRQAGQLMRPYAAVRTKYFDEFFAAAANAGVEQAVILASGLDTRPYRTLMPGRTFEIDQPAVLEFKTRVLDEAQAQPRTEHSMIGIDLRQDWRAALLDAGFSAAVRTAWLAEGLLGYLPLAAQGSLLAIVDELSAPGSVASVEETGRIVDRIAEDPALTEAFGKVGAVASELVFDPESVDVAAWFTGHGWSATPLPATDCARRYRTSLDDHLSLLDVITFVDATKQ